MQPQWTPRWLSYALEWAHQEQALLAGLLALLGAGLTVFVLNKQIRQQRDQWNESTNRQFRSKRAKLPWALSDIVEYTQDIHATCNEIYDQFDGSIRRGRLPAQPQLPQRAIEVIAENIEWSERPDVTQALESILSELQVAHARLSSTFRTLGREPEVGNVNDKPALAYRGLEAEILNARTSCLFEYARNFRQDVKEFKNKADAIASFDFDGRSGKYHDHVKRLITTQWPDESEGEQEK